MDLISSEVMQRSIDSKDSKISIIDYLEVFYKHKKMLTRVTLSFFFLSILVSLVLPNIYTARAKVLPPQQDQLLLSTFLGQMGLGAGIANIAKDLTGSGTEADMYVGMLDSETIKDKIIDKFKLMEVYGEKYRVETYKQLDKRVEIQAGKKDSIITISVEDKNPQRAADIANTFVEYLSNMTIDLDSISANKNRQFLENRLIKARGDLAKAEESIKSFQLRNKALDITEQAKGTIKGIADIEAQLAIEEVKLSSLKHSYTDSSQEVKQQKYVIQGIKAQIAKFEGMRPEKAIIGVGSVPEVAKDYLRVMREFKTQEALVELLTKQKEIAELIENKGHSSLQVIQLARTPDKKTKPKRAIIIFGSTLFGFLLSMLVAFTSEYYHNLPLEQKARIKIILSENGIKFFKK